MDVELELLAFDEKIRLAELEVTRAQNRVKELEYEKSRFLIDIYRMHKKEKANAAVPQ